MAITKRFELGHWQRQEDDKIVHLKRSNERVEAVELDLDSLREVGFPDFSHLIFALACFASKHPADVSTIYTYETLSVNRGYSHNAVFFAVVGNHSRGLLEAIKNALCHQVGVPADGIPETVRESTSTVNAWDSPDFIDIGDCEQLYHIEDGFAWKVFEAGIWFTDSAWI